MIPYNSNLEKAAVIIKKNGGLTPEKLMTVLEGSDYISVDLNEDETKVVVELDETKLDTTVTEDSDNLITSGAVYDAIADIDIPEYTAGTNVSISSGNVISATDTKYTAGTGINISSSNVISATGTAPVTSVNTKTGAVVLNAGDILATNTQSVQANLERIDGEVEEVIDDLATKLDATKSAVATVGGLVVPTATRTDDVLVGVSTGNDQMNIYVGDGLTLDPETNILSADGGGSEIPEITLTQSQSDFYLLTSEQAAIMEDINQGLIKFKHASIDLETPFYTTTLTKWFEYFNGTLDAIYLSENAKASNPIQYVYSPITKKLSFYFNSFQEALTDSDSIGIGLNELGEPVCNYRGTTLWATFDSSTGTLNLSTTNPDPEAPAKKTRKK